ncbi:hypothetical protein B0H19DRAFT_1072619 [Mycena capillaripes]|nr:hypothetical protein B0H19DRAFT_1072619 [Mycena capillaripes]
MSTEQIQTQLNSNTYFDLVSFSLFYEYWITLDWEISRCWGARALFFANRYGTLLGNISVARLRESRCLALESYHQYFIIATQVLVGAMLLLRTYALYERRKRVLTLMITVSVGGGVVGLWSILTVTAVDKSANLPLYFGCDYPTSRAQGLGLAATWARRGRVRLHVRAVYFGVMLLSNLSNIATLVLGTPHTRGIATTFTNVISSVMITRLMFNIRDPALKHMAGTHSTSVTADIRFASDRREGETGQTGVELKTDIDATMGKRFIFSGASLTSLVLFLTDGESPLNVLPSIRDASFKILNTVLVGLRQNMGPAAP